MKKKIKENVGNLITKNNKRMKRGNRDVIETDTPVNKTKKKDDNYDDIKRLLQLEKIYQQEYISIYKRKYSTTQRNGEYPILRFRRLRG